MSWEEAIAIWDSLPGIGRCVAEGLVAKVGTDLTRFPTDAHLASWAKLSPGNKPSAGKRLSGRTGKGTPWVRSTLIQAARAAVRTRDSYLAAFYRRLAARRGDKKAIVAVAHKLLDWPIPCSASVSCILSQVQPTLTSATRTSASIAFVVKSRNLATLSRLSPSQQLLPESSMADSCSAALGDLFSR